MSIIDEQKKKQADPRYHKVKKLKKITVVKLGKMLKKKLEKERYINLQFDKPEIGVQVVVPFIVQDAQNKREEYDSRRQLKKLIKTTLEKTNWRLMSEGVNYRLGYLSGRLKGYETEEDLIKIVK